MRVVTTSAQNALAAYGQRWLDGRQHWPQGTEFHWYTEGYAQPEGTTGKDFAELPFSEWKAKHAGYVPPSWQFDVVRYAHKVFAAIDALYDYDGIGVWLDADCVTYAPIPEGYIEKQVAGVYLARFARTGLYTETGMWMVNCADPQHRDFLDTMRGLYLGERYQELAQWHDCFVLDAAVRLTGVPTFNLSGEFHKDMHPMAKADMGQYIDHCKGGRKLNGFSPENKFRKAA